MNLELWQLELRYAAVRTQNATKEKRLLASLAGGGQQVPIVVLADSSGRYVVVDGYKRVRCARRLGWDTLAATSWELSEAEAVILELVLRSTGRGNALEEGGYLRELSERFGLSLRELARRFCRSESWVSRRLALVAQLPEEIKQGVLTGRIVAHGAMKHLVPMARANRADCLRLYAAIRDRGLSSRQLGRLWAAYRSGKRARELVVSNPEVVLKLGQGAGDSLLGDLVRLADASLRTRKRAERGVGLGVDQRDEGHRALRRAESDVVALVGLVLKEAEDAGRRDAGDDPEAQGRGQRDAVDCARSGDLAGSGEGCPEDRRERSAERGQGLQGRASS